MSTVPKITDEHWQAADKATGGYNYVEMCNKAIEIALAEQQEGEYITAAQARELGAGNAEWLNPFTKEWRICVKDLRYLETMSNDGKNVIKYRAIKQAQPEPVGPHAALRAEYAKQVKEGTTGFYLWEVDRKDQGESYRKLDTPDELPAWSDGYTYRCTDISCYVSKDGEPATRMLRTEAQELQRKTKDTHDWWMPSGVHQDFWGSVTFEYKGTYTYRTKPTIKLDGNMVTPEQAAAEWDAKKESHQLWFKFKDYKWEDVIGYPENMVEYFKDSSSIFELRPKQPTWTGSREDVIALLKEMELL